MTLDAECLKFARNVVKLVGVCGADAQRRANNNPGYRILKAYAEESPSPIAAPAVRSAEREVTPPPVPGETER